jgi:hypothetical protein
VSDADSGPVELAALSLEYHAGNPVVIYTANQIMKSAKAFGHQPGTSRCTARPQQRSHSRQRADPPANLADRSVTTAQPAP